MRVCVRYIQEPIQRRLTRAKNNMTAQVPVSIYVEPCTAPLAALKQIISCSANKRPLFRLSSVLAYTALCVCVCMCEVVYIMHRRLRQLRTDKFSREDIYSVYDSV